MTGINTAPSESVEWRKNLQSQVGLWQPFIIFLIFKWNTTFGQINKNKQSFFFKTKTLPIGQFQRWPSKPTEIYLTYILGKLKASRRAWIRTPYFCPISVATRGNLNHSGVRYSTLQSVRFLQISFIEYTPAPTSERDTPGKIICLSLNWVAIRSRCKYNRITIANFLRNIKRFICIILRLQIE